MLEIYIIEQLAALAEYGTLSKVSEVLHISQPAISRSMQKAEDELGVSLFVRGKNRIAFNELGELAARHARIVLSAHNEMIRAVREADRRRRTFSYGAIAPAPMWTLTPLLSQLFPGQTVSADLQETEASLVEGLNQGNYNLIVLLRPLAGGGCYSRPFMREKLSILLPRTHRLAGRKSIYLADLSGEKLLIHNKIGFWYSICQKKIPQAIFLEQSELSTLREIVNSSDLPSFVTNISDNPADLPQNKVAVPILDSEVNVTFYCVCLADRRREYAAIFSALENAAQRM